MYYSDSQSSVKIVRLLLAIVTPECSWVLVFFFLFVLNLQSKILSAAFVILTEINVAMAHWAFFNVEKPLISLCNMLEFVRSPEVEGAK